MQDYSKMNPNDFSQKDLMLHLLQVSQHTVTRGELKEDISLLKQDIARVEARFDKVDERFNNVDERFNKIDEKISNVKKELKEDISKIDKKFDRVQWLIVATILSVLLKDYVISLLQGTPAHP
ncbi:MAG: hypothetical protein CSA86_02625 [Arcobacter sp.]|nr:MAG: hypothetical protein CSA86_02625 [Arcobacter sp.]